MVDTIDTVLCLLAAATLVYLLGGLCVAKPKRRRDWPWLISGVVLSCLAGYGWTLLSLFVLPWLLGADFSAAPVEGNAAASSEWVEITMQQAVPSGVVIAALGSLWTIKKRPS